MITKRYLPAFTIVEMMVVVAVLGILVGITTFSYRGWQEGIAEKEVKSDLLQIAGSMKNSLNFNNAYPENIPLDFSGSPGVNSTYTAGDERTFCIDGYSKKVSSIRMFVTEVGQIKKGSCAEGEISDFSQIANFGKRIKSISSGSNHTCAVAMADSKAYCWGYNAYGQVGNNSTVNSTVPVAVSTSGVLSGKTIKTISSGLLHTCAIASDDLVYCWGYNAEGQLGNNSTVNSTVPVAVSTSGVLSGKTIKTISSGSNGTCAIASDNNAYCWGNQSILGNNSALKSTVPVAVSTSGVLSGKTIKTISVGGYHACAIASDNNAYCWGDNANGRLGANATNSSLVPIAVTNTGALSGKSVKSVVASYDYTCAIASDNNAYCWGAGSNGRLGRGSTNDSLTPSALYTIGVLSGKTIKSVAASNHSCAIASDNNAYCWGAGSNGMLGNNSSSDSWTAVAVSTTGVLSGKTVKSVSVGGAASCAIASDDLVYCWGNGTNSELGNNSLTSSSVPVKVNDF